MKIKYATHEIRLHRKCLALKIIDEESVYLYDLYEGYQNMKESDLKTVKEELRAVVKDYYEDYNININKTEFEQFSCFIEEYIIKLLG